MRCYLSLALLFLSLVVRATHIIGGELYYDHLSGDSYQVTLKLYRDCGPGNTNGTGYDATAELGVFSGAGAYLFSSVADFPGATSVPVTLDDPCLSAPPTVCVEVAAYTFQITLPPTVDGYILTYQRCCRSPTIMNIPDPQDWGLTCTVQVPPMAQGLNSSPRFTAVPPIALCVDQDMSFNYAATDPDGDQLVYALTTPFTGGDNINPIPSPPSAPPYTEVPWASGYSEAVPMDADPGLAIDAATGLLTVHPNTIGSYTVAVSVKEYRNGVLLSEVRRDLRFDVAACSDVVSAIIAPQQDPCLGLTMPFGQQGSGGQVWHWDFGQADTQADTANTFAPTWTYPAAGTYPVTLIVNPGYACADTAQVNITVSVPPQPFFAPPPPFCGEGTFTLNAGGTFSGTASFAWDLGAHATPSQASGASVQVTFPPESVQPVTLTVTQDGCTASYTANVAGHPIPTALFAVDPAPPQLQGTPIQFIDSSQPNGGVITSSIWTLDGDTMPWSGLLPDWLDATPGEHIITLVVTTSDGCSDTYTMPYTVTAGDILIPNVFSPNGDGSNDRFVIQNVQFHPNHLQIYNRWGIAVFEATNYHNQWSGGGLSAGTYFYVLQVDDKNYTGHVTLLR